MKRLIILAVILATSTAYAGGHDYNGAPATSIGVGATAGAGASSDSTNKNRNNNTNSAAQGQTQGESQGQEQAQIQGQTTANTANNTGTSASSNATTVAYSQPKAPVNTAYAASLTSGLDTCLGSASGGAQIAPIGVSLGSTKTDANCVLIKQVALLRELGHPRAACYRATAGKEGEAIKAALAAAGESCDAVPTADPAPVSSADLAALEARSDEKLRRATERALGK